jgi:prepilin-type N-terminal cleavage/methylation domain-containing protein
MTISSSRVRGGHVREGHLSGFTLIELLVVIAIIGILSSVVLASLNTARNKGNDAAIKSNLAEARAQAELFYDANGNSYAGVCGATAVNGVKTIQAAVIAAQTAYNGGTSINTTYTTAGSADTTKGTCHDSSAGWGAEVPLKTSGYFCVDSTGVTATTSASTLGANDVACN